MAQETMRSLERGLSVLGELERSPGHSLHDLHRRTGLPKPTLLRILTTLEANGYARRRIGDGTWRRTARGAEEPESLLEALLLDIGGEELDNLCRRVVWPSDLAIYRDGAMQILETSRSLTPFLVNRTGIGLRVPVLPSGLGRAWLAFCSDVERAAIIERLAASDDPFDRPAREPAAVEAIVEETRAKGYGVRATGFQPRRLVTEDKTSGVALPVLANGTVVASINLVWILAGCDEATFVRQYLIDLRETAERIGRRIEAELAARRG